MDYQKFSDCFSKINDFDLVRKSYQDRLGSSQIRNYLNQAYKPPSNANKAAVLLFCYSKKDKMHLSLIKRAEYKGVHSAQVSFPGGKFEEQDKSLWQTALRECNEELGTKLNFSTPLLKLTPVYIPPSNFLVSPFVVGTMRRPSFNPDRREVQEFLELPLCQLIDLKIEDRVLLEGRKAGTRVPCFVFENHLIWGATAMILLEFKIFLENQL